MSTTKRCYYETLVVDRDAAEGKLKAAFEQGGMGGQHGFGAGFASSFSDIIEDLFGMTGQRRGSGRERGADLRYNMEITLEEAYLGKTAQIAIPVSVTCESCSGTGAKAGTKPKTSSM